MFFFYVALYKYTQLPDYYVYLAQTNAVLLGRPAVGLIFMMVYVEVLMLKTSLF